MTGVLAQLTHYAYDVLGRVADLWQLVARSLRIPSFAAGRRCQFADRRGGWSE